MRLITISYIGDEEDIVEQFVRHHAQIADLMIIVCTARDEATPRILFALKKEGLPIELSFHQPAFHDQADVLSRVLHDVIGRYAPQWILPLDADEFLQAEDMIAAFGHLPRHRVTLVPWRTYVPTVQDPPEETDVRRRIMHRRDREDPPYYKVLIPSAIVTADTAIAAGSHELLHAEGRIPYEGIPADRLWLAHFPVRSEAQIRRKVRNGWNGILHNPQRGRGEGYHWRELSEQLAGGTPINITDIALHYCSRAPHAALIRDPIRPPMHGSGPMPSESPPQATHRES